MVGKKVGNGIFVSKIAVTVFLLNLQITEFIIHYQQIISKES